MLSIVICSTNPKLCNIVNDNIRETIGVEYEIVLINNSNNDYSIFSAYNEGIKRSHYPIIVFMHEDIMFRSNNWGKLIYEAFNTDNQIGMIGVIGATMIFDMSWGWWNGPKVGSIIQSDKSKKRTNSYLKCNDKTPNLSDVAICDGLFLAFPKNIFKKISFDTETFNGFHGYDMDISMQVLNSGYKIKVIENIIIEHFSWGNINEDFIDACYKFYNKWRDKLPISISSIPYNTLLEHREKYIKRILRLCPKSKILKNKSWVIYNKLYNIYQHLKLKR